MYIITVMNMCLCLSGFNVHISVCGNIWKVVNTYNYAKSICTVLGAFHPYIDI